MKTKITTLLVDDEPKSLAILAHKINRFCPKLDIIGSIQSPEKALTFIEKSAPQLVFLDVTMPVMNGFELLSRIANPSFEVIFATAFDQYAIDAINHCAIGYLTKPINNENLQQTVKNAVRNIEEKTAMQKNKAFVDNFLAQNSSQKIAIPSAEGFDFVRIEEIIRCQGIDGYTRFFFEDRPDILSSYSIGRFKKLLIGHNFFQTHKSHIINLAHITKYYNDGSIELSNNHTVPLTRRRKIEFLDYFTKAN